MTLKTRLTFVLASAILIPLSFPPYGYWPLLLLALPTLLWATTNTSARHAFYLGLLHGLIAYGMALYWFRNIFGTAAIPLFAVLAVFTAGFCLSFNHISKTVNNPTFRMLLAAVLWTAFEFYRCELFVLRFPWITPGSALGPTALSPIVGVYGTSFVVVLAAAGFLHRRTQPLALGLVLGVLGLGYLKPQSAPLGMDRVTVTVVQNEDCVLQSYVTQTRKAHNEAPDLVVWPEYALPYDIRRDRRDFATLQALSKEMNAVFVVGTKTKLGEGDRQWHNTALTLAPQGVLGEYHKSRTVHFFNDGIPGNSFEPILTHLGRIGTPICFDCDNSEVVRQMAIRGAEYFAVPTFDAAHWSADQHLQHALLFRLRAAENRRWIACSASSGVSQIIDPYGQVRKQLPPLKTGNITHTMGKNQELTFFTRAGWLFPWFTLVGGASSMLFSMIRRGPQTEISSQTA